ncbi:S-phase kinase-associated protein 2 [Anopheles ziemanni]|uniref:S-phase kinase-associated protein 2 n=1 Tax=Anopheles ziemanni TaxID=345580 RepID=UPI00265A8FD4|nr:S-phase kinase-associated protein 2 isoform X1 [Anopheles coustani]XP_058169350.1 S-phase kinase-associated protein 2 [Anopheles ziemanni]
MDPPSNKTRQPLTNVSNNVSQRLQKHSAASTEQSELSRKHSAPAYCDTFFVYKKCYGQHFSNEEDPFDRLSDEVILQIFKWLPKKSLLACGEVNHRFNRVSKDETLWVRLDLSCRRIKTDALSDILNRGIVVLRMSQASIARPDNMSDAEFSHRTKLQYLDLSMCTVDKDVLCALLASCRSLIKLSLENVPLNEQICAEIAANPTLESLNLTMCSGISATGMRTIAKGLTKLQSLNVGWAYLSSEAVTELVHNLTPHILRLNLAGCRSTLGNEGLAVLVKRCPRLLELDLSDCTQLNSEAIQLVCRLRKLEYLSLSRCYNINVTSYLSLTDLRSLLFLDLFGLMSDNAIATLQHSFAGVGINKFYHSSVARPTVGTRRTSIWGIRTRE